jgi:predicted N-acetyltransferase YhbS
MNGGYYMDIKIRIANEKDFDKIEFIVRESFWNIYTPGCDEHLIIHNIHKNVLKIDIVRKILHKNSQKREFSCKTH